MFKIILKNLTQKLEYVLLSLLIILTVMFIGSYNQKQNKHNENINKLINNVYFEKTIY